jgi:hypothetical protein
MATIVTRETTQTDGTSPKGSPLTNAEVDTNFINLNDDKVEVSGAIIFQAQAGEALTKGDVVYVSGVSGNTPVVSKADADDASKMPAYGLAEADANLNAAVNVVTFGTLYDLDTSSFAAGDIVYVSTTAGAITDTAPTGESSLLQNIGTVIRSHASAGSIKVGGAGRTNATPNLNDGNVFIGNASNQAEARALTGDDISGGTITSFASTGIDDNATSTAITIDSSQNTTFAGTITSGDIIISEGTPLLRIQDSDGTNQYTQLTNTNGNTYVGSRNDTADGNILIGGYGGGSFTEFARWSDAGNLTQKNNLIVQGAFTSLGIDDNASSTVMTIGSGETTFASDIVISASSPSITLDNSDNPDAELQVVVGSGSSFYRARGATGHGVHVFQRTNGTDTLKVFQTNSSGDVIFYENDGVTSGLTWDASASKLTNFTSTGIDDNANDTAITIDTNENVGIGVTDPDNLLTVGGGTQPRILIRANGDAGASQLNFGDASDIDVGRLRYDHSDDSMGFFTSATERLRVTSNGNLLIGRETETLGGGNGDDLQIGSGGGGAGLTIHSSTTSNGDIQFADGTTGNSSYRGLIRYLHAQDALDFWTAGTQRIRIDSDGETSFFGGGVSLAKIGNIGPSSNSAIRISRIDSTVSTGNPLGYLEFGSNDATGSTDTPFAYVAAEAEGTFASADNPTALAFGVTPDGSGAVAEAMRITNAGELHLYSGAIDLTDQEDPSLPVRVESTGTLGNGGAGYDSSIENSGQLQLNAASVLITDNSTVASGFPTAWYEINNGFSWGKGSSTIMSVDGTDSVYEASAEHSFTVNGVEELRITNTETSVFGTSGDIFTLVDTNLTASASNIGNVRIAWDDSAGTRAAYVGTVNSGDFFVNNQYGSVKLTSAGSTKLTTVSDGIDVTGGVTASGTTILGNTTTGSGSPRLYVEATGNYTRDYDTGVTGIHVGCNNGTAAEGAYGGSISFGRISSSSDDQSAAIALVQCDADPDQSGLAFFYHGSNTRTVDLVEGMRLDNDGRLGIGIDNIEKELEVQLANTTTTTLGQKGGLQFRSASSTVGNGGEITWASGTGNTERWCAISGHITTNTATGSVGDLVFATKGAQADTAPTERMRILSSGGLTFNGDTSTNNALDDYEEGTYTVRLYDASTGGNQSTNSVTGYYTKIGRVVTVNIYAFNNIGRSEMTSSNVAYFNLPFASGSNGRHVGQVNHHGWTYAGNTSYQTMMPQVTQNASRGYFVANGYGVGDATVKVSDIGSGTDDIVTLSLTYHV